MILRSLIFLLIIQTPRVEVLEKSAYKALVEQGYQVIDVRTPEEFTAGHIPGAKNINVKSQEFVEEIQKLSTSDTLLVYCRSGKRSAYASQVMVAFPPLERMLSLNDLEVSGSKMPFSKNNSKASASSTSAHL